MLQFTARDLFIRCGNKLKRRRQENEWRIASSRLTVDTDPAEQSVELKEKLEKNKKIATCNVSAVLDK